MIEHVLYYDCHPSLFLHKYLTPSYIMGTHGDTPFSSTILRIQGNTRLEFTGQIIRNHSFVDKVGGSP